jgi:hypothetical protein
MCTVDKAANDCAGLAAGLGGRAGGRGRSDTDKVGGQLHVANPVLTPHSF